MKCFINIILFSGILVGCTTASGLENARQATSSGGNHGNLNATASSTIETSPGENRGSVNATEASPMETLVNNATSGSKPNVIKVRPPMVPIGSASTLPAGWQTYTSTALGVAVQYPGDWSAIEQADGVTFTSPQGAKIQLQAIKINDNNAVSENNNQQCATLINAHGLSVDTCVDTRTYTYSAKFSLKSNIGLTQQLSLSTTGKNAMEVYKQMLDSLRPSP